jgi:dTDP-4-dehydrorhamnose reductase
MWKKEEVKGPPALWGGVECSVVRIGDQYSDQIRRNGHQERLDDLDRFAALGLKALRFPILWERTAPEQARSYDWTWTDERLARLRALGIRPIAGLLHHGSGPHYATFERSDFPEQFAQYARDVAERYPHLDAYTPLNEPLTTARFAGLYGIWYPHGRDDRSFVRILLNQLRATVLAMREIRQVNPAAELIQTEDLARVHGTPALAREVAFENERRRLTYDLLTGRVVPGHPLYEYLCAHASEAEVVFFAENPCPPDVLGCNYYVTSERYFDHGSAHFPHFRPTEAEPFLDIEAVRCPDPAAMAGWETLLEDTATRYHRPIAITEAHLGCTREEQMRWFHEAYQAATRLRGRGIDVRAVTAWALLGSFDWNSLLTRSDNHYEPGLFDVRGPAPRPTALARLVGQLARHESPDEPVLAGTGWWQRTETPGRRYRSPRPLLIVGAGTLGRALARLATQRGLAHRLLARAELDITDPAAVADCLRQLRPWAVVNAAGYVRVDRAEWEREACWRANARGAAILAEACPAVGAKFLTYSSDLVFDGTKRRPYVESDPTCPQNVYGSSKAAAETRVLQAMPEALVIRTSAFFGPWDEANFATIGLRRFFSGEDWQADDHVRVSPTYVPDLVQASLDLLIDDGQGRWHLSNAGDVSWADFARQLARRTDLDPARIEEWYQVQRERDRRRPRLSTVLTSERGHLMPTLDHAMDRYLADCEFDLRTVLAGVN